MTKDEALALALEALEKCLEKGRRSHPCDPVLLKTKSAITAIKQAQQAPEAAKMVTPYITQEHFDRAFPIHPNE